MTARRALPPAGSTPMSAKPIFVVHEHHASRRHFDLRLEIAGVLKSWAVPKGPSLNPADKRLAVLVDDHLMEYAKYEGIIPAGGYGAGPVVIWDEGWIEWPEGSGGEAQWDAGSLKFVLHGTRLRGAFALVKMKGPKTTGKEWLLMKKRDEAADDRFSLESALTPDRKASLKERVPPCEAS
ncbi:MAG TPA: DNA polymerase ligase N-terminal domain-containing protein [bacterium]